MRSQRPISSLLLSLILILCGIALIIWSLVSANFRDPEGYLTGPVVFPISVGIALWITALLWARNLRNFVLWFSLAIISQAAALQLIEAGKEVRYQHYVPASQLLTSAYVLFSCILLVQVFVVLVGLRTRIRSILSWIVRNFRLWQIILLVVVFVITSAALSRELDRYLYEIIIATMVQVVFSANLGLAFVAIPEDIRISWTARFNDWLDSGETGTVISVWFSRHFNFLAALWVTLLALFLSYFIYQSHPHVQDEVIYLFHARYLAEGLLKVPAPAVPEAFTLYMIPYKAAQWYSIFPPGWPAILSLGVLVGAPWLVNPVLGGVGILLAGRFLRISTASVPRDCQSSCWHSRPGTYFCR